MRRADLERLVRAAGGVGALARQLGVHRSTLQSWRKHGLPKGRVAKERAKQALEGLKVRRREARTAGKRDRATFALLMKEAGELDLLPVVRTEEGRRSGPRTQGYKWTKRIDRIVNEDVIQDVLEWGRSLERRFPIWQGTAVTSQYGKSERHSKGHKGYGTVYVQLPKHPIESGDFAIKSLLSTPKNTVREHMLDVLEQLLADFDEEVMVFLHAVTIYNYKLRTTEERRGYMRGRQSRWRMNERRKAKRKSRAGKS